MGICEVEHDFGWVCVCLGMSCWLYVGWFVLLQVFLGYLAGPIDFKSIHDTREIDQTHVPAAVVVIVVTSSHFSVTGLF